MKRPDSLPRSKISLSKHIQLAHWLLMLLNPGSNQHLISVRQGKDPHNSVVNKLHTYRISLPEASVCRLILNSHLHSIILLYLSTIRAGCDKSTVRML